MNGNEQLGASKCLKTIETAFKETCLKLLVISVWGIVILEAKGRITFEIDCMVWVNRALTTHGISLLPIMPKIAIASNRLPGNFHGDPAGRIINRQKARIYVNYQG